MSLSELLPSSRRTFMGAMTAASYTRVQGANDRVRLGIIGCGLIGLRHIADFKEQKDAALVAVSDVHHPRVEAGQSDCGPGTKGYADFRKLLDDREIDAVVVATPDHWHALQTIMACAAGKDVYVEKPMTLFVQEGRWMVTAARRYKRIVQVGTQGRSGAHFPEVMQLVAAGHIGKIHSVRFASFRNVMPGFGAPKDAEPPSSLDYELFLGPAPRKPYNPNRSLYNFRWFWDFSGGQMTNLGAHDLDLVHMVMKAKAPSAVSSSGGRFVLEDNGETPDTQDALFEYPGFTVAASIREACAGRRAGGGPEFCGTKGSMVAGRGGFEVFPEMRVPAERQIPPWSKPPAHPQPENREPTPWTQARKGGTPGGEPMALHKRNWLDCIKSRQLPAADVEEGHRVSTACHLANISMRLGRKLRWDAEKEDVIGDREASSWLVRPYRKPWDEVLRSFKL
jgi:predicted dehydrogenase